METDFDEIGSAEGDGAGWAVVHTFVVDGVECFGFCAC